MKKQTVQMNKSNPVSWVAFIWGCMTFMSVGVHYLGLFALLIAVISSGSYGQRFARLKDGLLLGALCLFTVWTLVVLALQDLWFDKTLSHLWHQGRIALTLALAASLSKAEATTALKGFLAGCIVVLCIAIMQHFQLVTVMDYWMHLNNAGTNKTIGAAILMSMLAGLLFAYTVHVDGRKRWFIALALLVVIAVIAFVLSKRTAMLTLVLGMLAVVIHAWRDQKWRWLSAVLVLILLMCWIWTVSPKLQGGFAQGLREVDDALVGNVKVESWNVRIQMIKHSWYMMIERPWLGWGIGSWNEQWKQRVPVEIADFNMPHNDALWMGAQAGIVGASSWLLLMLSGLSQTWRSRNWMGAAATAAICIATFASLVNNGTRDATIGIPMLWIMGVMISYSRDSLNHSMQRMPNGC